MQRLIATSLLVAGLIAAPLPGIGRTRTIAQVIGPVAAIDRLDEDWWADRHRAILAMLPRQRDADVVLIGDSITNNYDKAILPDENFQPTWQAFYAPRHAINLGFSGDTTANVIWRLRHGEVAGLKPRVAIVLIGTNDTGWKKQGVSRTARGIDAVVGDLVQRLPSTRILLLGILPSDISAQKTTTDAAINRHLARRYRGSRHVTYLDLDSVFRTPTGKLDTAIFYDPRLPQRGGALHPDTIGQRRMAEAIEPTLAKLLSESPRTAPEH